MHTYLLTKYYSEYFKSYFTSWCVHLSFCSKLELVQHSTYPSIGTSNRLWMRQRRLVYSRRCSTGSQACRIKFNMVYPLQLIFNGHKSSRAFVVPISLGEESSSLSKGEKQRDANDTVPDYASKEDSSSKISSDDVMIQNILPILSHRILRPICVSKCLRILVTLTH